jgi:hypothetical protein
MSMYELIWNCRTHILLYASYPTVRWKLFLSYAAVFTLELPSSNMHEARQVKASIRLHQIELKMNFESQVYQHMKEPFIGLLKEKPAPILGKTQHVIFSKEFGSILFGPSGSWWMDRKEEVHEYFQEVLDVTLGKVINANTGANVDLDAFHV